MAKAISAMVYSHEIEVEYDDGSTKVYNSYDEVPSDELTLVNEGIDYSISESNADAKTHRAEQGYC